MMRRFFCTSKKGKKEIVVKTELMKGYLRKKESPKAKKIKYKNWSEWLNCFFVSFFFYFMLDKIWKDPRASSNMFITINDVRARQVKK